MQVKAGTQDLDLIGGLGFYTNQSLFALPGDRLNLSCRGQLAFCGEFHASVLTISCGKKSVSVRKSSACVYFSLQRS